MDNQNTTKKAIFFDIDGTLWGQDDVIPESTKEAIRRLKEAGHLVIICTGRTAVYVQDEALLSLDFDGFIYGCGTRIDYKGETVFDREFMQEEAGLAVKVFKEHGMTTLMEGNEYFYSTRAELSRDPYGRYLYEALGPLFLEIDEHENDWHTSKLSVLLNGNELDPVKEKLDPPFDFILHGSYVMEIVPNGFSKSSGITHLCEILGIPLADTVAFGDSNNDIDMLKTVGIGVAMGNGKDEVKEIADYVTDSLQNDGILKACEHLGLI